MIAAPAELLELPVGEFVRRQAERYGSRLLSMFEDGRTLSYADAERESAAVAAGLLGEGLQPGSRVGVMLGNCREHVLVSFAIAKAGLQEIPVHAALRESSLEHILRAGKAKALVAQADFKDQFASSLSRLPDLELLVLVGGHDGPPLHGRQIAWGEVATHTPGRLPRVAASSTSTIMFTSGTTGLPKGVVRSHRADLLTGWRAFRCMGYREDDVLYNVFPLAHVNAKFNTLFGAMFAGARVLTHGRFSGSGFWLTVKKHGVTSASFQGAMLEILWKTRQPEDRENPLRTGRAAPIPVALHRQFEEYFGVQLYQSYGQTETGIVAFNFERRPGKLGRPLEDFYEVSVLDADDNPVPRGTPGILAIRPRVPFCMSTEYLDMPEHTLRVQRNFWFHSGDLVTMDDEGYLAFVSRNVESIRRRGENISPVEVEQAVAQVPGVLECAAFGVPSALGEDEVMIAVVLQDGNAGVRPQAIAAYCEKVLPRFALPRYIRFVDALPKTDSQRTIKARLKAEGITRDTWDREAGAGA